MPCLEVLSSVSCLISVYPDSLDIESPPLNIISELLFLLNG